MSVEHEDFLPPKNEESHIQELNRLAELLAVELRLGAKPERMITLAGPSRDLAHRLYCHYSLMAHCEEPRKPNPFGFGPESSN